MNKHALNNTTATMDVVEHFVLLKLAKGVLSKLSGILVSLRTRLMTRMALKISQMNVLVWRATSGIPEKEAQRNYTACLTELDE
ncbi:hypothetical protein D9615_008198 [Tricholomella constricta]|uniref:Uncharacterized protein n=1 Tax=Tricholomella constricta TaxID=117010 RepID=A0A8H5M073_9AGAR|nr:hypothetical protein D9615_008198 [Tricholomella constricta]